MWSGRNWRCPSVCWLRWKPATHGLLRQLACDAQADDGRHVQRSRSQPAFLAAAVDERFDRHCARVPAHVQRSDAFGPVDLVGADRQQVDRHCLDVERHAPERLRGVDMEDCVRVAHRFADGGNRLDRSDFVVGRHHRDEHGVGAQRTRDVVRIDEAVPVDRQDGEPPAFAFESSARVEHRPVLDRAGDQVRARPAARDALQRDGVRFGGPRREENFRIAGPEGLGDVLARLLDCGRCVAAEYVRAVRRVAVVLREVRQHCIEHARVGRRRGVVIEIDGRGHLGFGTPLVGCLRGNSENSAVAGARP